MACLTLNGVNRTGCDWLECSASYDTARGPVDDPGWQRATLRFWAGTVLCPEHAPAGHWPTTAGDRPELRVICGCGTEVGLNPGNGVEAGQMWHSHLAGLVLTS